MLTSASSCQKFRAYILADEKRTIDVMTHTIFTSLQLKDNLGAFVFRFHSLRLFLN